MKKTGQKAIERVMSPDSVFTWSHTEEAGRKGCKRKINKKKKKNRKQEVKINNIHYYSCCHGKTADIQVSKSKINYVQCRRKCVHGLGGT